MPQRRLSRVHHRRHLLALFACGLACGITGIGGAAELNPAAVGSASTVTLTATETAVTPSNVSTAAQPAAAPLGPVTPVTPNTVTLGPLTPGPVTAKTATGSGELELTAPINSTLEIRVARRPWLLEKLTGSSGADESIKMNPPSPPAELPDPPSMSRITPQTQPADQTPYEEDNWVRRDGLQVQTPAHPAVELVAPDSSSDAAAKPTTAKPLRDPAPASKPPAYARVGDAPSDLSADDDRIVSDDDEAMQIEVLNPEDNESLPADEQSKPAAKSSRDAEADQEAQSDKITIRELDLQRDGSLKSRSAAPESSQSDRRGDRDIDADEAISELKNAPATGRRGSLTDTELETLPDEPVLNPEIELDYTGFPKDTIRLSSTVARMRSPMSQVLQYYYARPEVANERSNWGMLHAIMVYGIDTQITAGNRSYSAIAWIAGNNACRGQRLLAQQNGRIVATSGVGLQGHQGQMLAIFSLCDVPEDYPLYADQTKYSVRDIVESEMLTCKSGEELTFTLIGLSHYLDTDATWRSADGQQWDMERLIREELSQPIVGAACGGTHRLMGFAHALRKRRAEGKPITGQWKRAERFTADFITYAYRLQNRDGSFSTDWFEGLEDNGDVDRKIQTTGHIVEWLLSVTPDSELQNPRLVAAVRFLLTSFYNDRTHDWSIGPKGHALRSLAMYYERVYQSGPAWRDPAVASGSAAARR